MLGRAGLLGLRCMFIAHVNATQTMYVQELRSHPDLTHMLGLADVEVGASVSGARGYFLMHEGVLLNQVF